MATEMKPFTLLTGGSPNGWKVSITLEELALPYEPRAIDVTKMEQKEAWFTAINPNGRFPALQDPNQGNLPVFESGAIMYYLATNYDKEHKLWPKGMKAQTETMNWLMFQMGGLGPMQGQAVHFVRFASEHVEYGINRYVNETRRLYEVMDAHLEGKKWLAADQFTIADIACFSWVHIASVADIKMDDLPNLVAWTKRVGDRPAVQKGLNILGEIGILKAVHEPEMMAGIKSAVQPMMVSSVKA